MTPLAWPLSTSRWTRGACSPSIELGGEALGVEAQLVASRSRSRLRAPRGLIEPVVHRPEGALGRGRLRGLGRALGERVDVAQREVAEGEQQTARELVPDALHDRVGGGAVRALEVAVHDQLQLGAARDRPRGPRPESACVRAGATSAANRRLAAWGAVERDRGPDRAGRCGGGSGAARGPGRDPLPDRARARRTRDRASSPAAPTSSSIPRSSSSSSCRRCSSRPATAPRRRSCARSSEPLTGLVLGLSLGTMVAVAAWPRR